MHYNKDIDMAYTNADEDKAKDKDKAKVGKSTMGPDFVLLDGRFG